MACSSIRICRHLNPVLLFCCAQLCATLAAESVNTLTVPQPALYVDFENSTVNVPAGAFTAQTAQGAQNPQQQKPEVQIVAGRSGSGAHIEPDPNKSHASRYNRLAYTLPHPSTEWTVAFWVKFDKAIPVGELFRLDFGPGWEQALFFVAFDAYNQLSLRAWNLRRETIGGQISGKGGLTPDRWHHLTFTGKQGTFRVYVDGYEANYKTNLPLTGEIQPVRELRFGGDLALTLDELKYYPQALSLAQIPLIMPPAPSTPSPAPIFIAPLDGKADGHGPNGEVPANIAEVEFVPALLDRGALLMRYGYDRRTQLSFGPISGLFSPEFSASFFFQPNWEGSDGVMHGLLAGEAGKANWEIFKNEAGDLVFILQSGEATATLKTSATFFKKGKTVHFVASYSQSARRLSVFADGREIASAPMEKMALTGEPGRLIVGDRLASDVYSKSQAEGIVDDIRLYSRALSPAECAAQAARRSSDAVNAANITLPITPANAPEAPLWDLAGATRNRTATREKICLNALWRCQLTEGSELPVTGAWRYLAVPGRYSGHENGMSENGFQFRDSQMKIIPMVNNANLYNGKPGHDYRTAWFERTFLADPAWKDRMLVLVFDEIGQTQSSDVYLNGGKIADLANSRFYEVALDPQTLRWGGENQLSLRVSDTGNRWAWRGIKGDVWLELRPSVQLLRPQLITSVREKKLTIRALAHNASGQPQSARLQCSLTGDAAPQSPLVSPVCSIPAGASVPLEISCPWPQPRLWETDDPYLYHCQLALSSSGGKVLDEMPVSRFGFREFWIDKADFLLNGVKINLRGDDNWYGFTDDPAWCRRWTGVLKKLGFNCVRGPFLGMDKDLNFENVLTACDENGILVFADAGGVRGGSFATWNNPETRRQVESAMRGRVEPWINHPSIVMWYLSVNFLGYGLDYHPKMVADGYEPAFLAAKSSACLQGAQMLLKADPTRPYFFQAGGNFGPVYTSNGYFGWWPLAEQMAWPQEWRKQPRKPLFMIETSFPYSADWQGMDLQNAARPLLLPENAARFLGDEAYRLQGTKEAELLGEECNNAKFTLALHEGLDSVWSVKCELLRHTLRAWRGAGISGFIPFEELSYAFPRKNTGPDYHSAKQTNVDPGDFRRPGWHPDLLYWPYQRDCDPAQPPTLVGRALQEVLAPVLVYIGGDADHPTARDHVYYSGDSINKSLVFVNDLRKPQHMQWRWSIRNQQSLPVGPGGTGQLDLQPGTVGRVALNTVAPTTTTGEDYTLHVELIEPSGITVEPFALRIHPRTPAAATAAIALYDPHGITTRAFQKRGAAFAPLHRAETLEGLRTVAVGCGGLDEGFAREARRVKLADAVRSGRVNVLIFEQKSLAALGLFMNAPYSRDVFAGGEDSPLLTNVAAAELSWPRGDGTLADAYPMPELTTEEKVKSPFWHWGNHNLAASFLPRRPGAAAARAHLTAGMDLLYAPLLEFWAGQGRILCCQWELSQRVGFDPAAAQLFDNLLRYSQEANAPAIRPLASLGDAAEAFMNRLGFVCQPVKEPESINTAGITVIAMQDGSWEKWRQILEAKANAGATLLFMPLNKTQLAEAGFDGQPVERMLRYELTAAGREWLGELSERDRFFRGMDDALAIQGTGLTSWAMPALVAERRHGTGRMVFLQLSPQQYEEKCREARVKSGINSSLFWCLTNMQDRSLLIWTTLLRRLGAPARDDLAKCLERPCSEIVLSLRGDWRFSIDPEDVGMQGRWFAPEFNDATWRTLRVPGTWENQGITSVNPHHPSGPQWNKDYDGYAWYRLRITLPQELRDRDLVFSAPGGIDDCDWTYVNGVEIGHTGAETPGYWSAARNYRIPASLTRDRNELVIAVRIFDVQGGGGMVSEKFELKTAPVPGPLLNYQPQLPGYDTETHIRW